MSASSGVVSTGGLLVKGLSDGSSFKSFRLSAASYKLAVFRVLLGTCEIEHPLTGKTSKFLDDVNKNRIDCFHIPYLKDSKDAPNARIKKFCQNFLDDEKLYKDLGSHFSDTEKKNIEFYKRLLTEICYAILHREDEPITAFVHIYRAVEVICFALPMLVYTAKNNDYIGGFRAFTQLISGLERSELPFFQKYLSILIKNDPGKDDVSFDILVSSADSVNADAIKKSFKAICDEEKITVKSVAHVPGSVSYDLSLGLLDFYKFLVGVRNRFFHYSTGDRDRNFDFTRDITNPNDIFHCINDVALNWLAIVFSDIIVEELRAT